MAWERWEERDAPIAVGDRRVIPVTAGLGFSFFGASFGIGAHRAFPAKLEVEEEDGSLRSVRILDVQLAVILGIWLTTVAAIVYLRRRSS